MGTGTDHRSRGAGFTLVEILVTVSVLGALAAVVSLKAVALGDQTRSNACAIEERQVNTALQLYFVQEGDYPPAMLDSGEPGLLALVPGYLPVLPGSHSASGGGTYDPVDGSFTAARC